MKRLLVIFFVCCFLIITTFLLFEDLEGWITAIVHSETSQLTFTLLSFSFLSLDTLLPVPSSLLMILNGKVLGFFLGSLVSLFSSLLSSVFGFYLGRSANPYFDKFFSRQDKAFSNSFFQKFGNAAIVISKALPILSEAISFVSGTTSLPFITFVIFSAPGHFVVSLIYGYFVNYSNKFHSGIVTIIIIVISVLVGCMVQKILNKKH